MPLANIKQIKDIKKNQNEKSLYLSSLLWFTGGKNSVKKAKNDSQIKTPVFLTHPVPPEKPVAPTHALDAQSAQKGRILNYGMTDDARPSFYLPQSKSPKIGERLILFVDNQIVPSTFDPTKRLITPAHPFSNGLLQVCVIASNAAGTLFSEPSDSFYITIDFDFYENQA